MSISSIEYKLFRDLKKSGILPKKPHVLELGEANWYGDVPIGQLLKDVRLEISDAARCKALEEELRRLAEIYDSGDSDKSLWAIAKIFFEVFLDFESITAIDLGGMEAALKLDLNKPVELDRQFDVTINFGTAEHILNIAQFFWTVHDLTRDGGLMMHGAPFQGWTDHGFYNIQPTFYVDLALANSYEIGALLYAETDPVKLVQLRGREQIIGMAQENKFGANAMVYGVFKKPSAARTFQIPMQGYYSGNVTEQAARAWETLR